MNEEEKKVIERLKRIDIKFFLSGMNEQSNYIVDEANKVNNAIETALNLLEKKDKMIDEMATYIATLDIEEDICEKTKNEHCDKMNFGECEDCIKQYFERKVENGN